MGLNATSTFTPGAIDGVLRAVAAGAQQGVQSVAQQLVETEQAYCPVRTGELRDSIAATVDQDEDTAFSMTVGPDKDYAAYVEYGTGRRGADSADAGPYPYDANWAGMTPEPYCRPALDEISPQYQDIVAAQIAGAL